MIDQTALLSQPVTPSWVTLTISQLPMIITSFGTLLVAISGFRKLAVGQDKAVAAAVTVQEKTHVTEKKIDAIHTLVNSEHSVSLRLAANYADRIANLTHDAGDIQAAEDAKMAADEHDRKQQVVNQSAQDPPQGTI